jgi:hypothetical protein
MTTHIDTIPTLFLLIAYDSLLVNTNNPIIPVTNTQSKALQMKITFFLPIKIYFNTG